jgi:predicted RNA-binding protein with PUA-like domain
MAGWLFKTEPSEYSYSDLEAEGETVWEGVSNALALKHLRSVQVGDRVLLYHTGKEKAIVGEIQISKVESDPPEIRVKAVRKWSRPVTLAEIKADESLKECDLVRLPRLSVMPISNEVWKRLSEKADSE